MKRHVLHLGKIAFSCSLIIGLFGLVLLKDNVEAAITNKYIANYDIKSARDKILGTFVEIDANDKVWITIPASKFQDLNTSFKTTFSRFPQDYSYKVVYEQCNLLTSQLGTISTTDAKYKGYFSSFMSNCYKPLTDILKQINSKYMVIPNAKVSPASGPSPLTVTFDARESTDPSNETIPSANFYRYYRDTAGQDQIIWNGPVLHYTFEKEWNYLVHLTAKSSNSSKGILDGDQTISVDVTPKAALVSLYANGQKMVKERKSKVGTLEAQKGVVFDASATIAMGGRQLMSYRREITSKEGFSFIKEGEGKPDLMRVSLPDKGEYKVHLEVLDNETNTTSEDYTIVVSDPVAIIKANPDKGNTSETFAFDGSPSYSVLSSLKVYTWEIYDENGNKLETYQGKSIKEKFKKPGFYVIKLTVEDELGQTNTDNLQVYVESTEPIPQYTITPADDWKYPSRFKLDGTVSTDVDKSNNVDSLSYEWSFPEEAKVNIISTDANNGQITAEFNAIGKFSCKLSVKDEYGKMSEITKDIEVKSILRPEITANPQATTWNTPINFSVKSNVQIANYQWDFGDSDKRDIQVDSIAHTYKTTNVYKVNLTVDDGNWMTNEISKTVFVGEKSYPIAGYQITDKSSKTLTQNETCTQSDASGQNSTTIPAYQVDRFSDITIDPTLSVNTKGGTNDLQFYFQPEKKEIYKQPSFNYKFDEVGCHYIDLTAEDTSISKNNTVRIWFKVVNSLPKLDNLAMLFPQYGNEVGVGFSENNQKNTFTTDFDPLIVKITATNPIDSDGFISYYKWYYFPKDDPTRYLETKITPGNVPYVFFSLPRIAGEYGFGVTMYDNDDGKKSSQEIIGNGPIVIFPPDASKPDIPLVTVKVNQSTVDVGDEVTFNVISKIISDREDFVKERTIYYDFDGDDKWDLITKKDKVTYTYPKASPDTGFRPKVQVLYRGNPGVAYGENIIVKDGLKPRLLYTSLGTFAIFRDVSLGPISTRTLCLDKKLCTSENTITGTGVKAFSNTYDGAGKYFATLNIGDPYANEAKKVLPITITAAKEDNGFNLLSIPEATVAEDKIDIMVWNNLDNTVLFYVKTNEPKNCYVDADISEDSEGDWIVDNDKDFACNTLYLKQYTPKYETTVGRIYYTENGESLSKEFTISFLDYEMLLDPQYKVVYGQINDLIKSINGTGDLATGSIITVRDMLKDLKNNLSDDAARMASIVSLKDYLDKNPITWNPYQDDLVKKIFLALSTKETTAAAGWSNYDVLKSDILAILPGDLLTQTNELFNQFDAVSGDATTQTSQQDKRKEILQQIVNLITAHVADPKKAIADNQIEKNDMDTIIMPDICSIMEMYSIPSSFCSTSTLKAVPDNLTVQQGTAPVATKSSTSIIKIIFIVLWAFVWIFVILVVIFAVRAKMRQEKDENAGIPTPQTQA